MLLGVARRRANKTEREGKISQAALLEKLWGWKLTGLFSSQNSPVQMVAGTTEYANSEQTPHTIASMHGDSRVSINVTEGFKLRV